MTLTLKFFGGQADGHTEQMEHYQLLALRGRVEVMMEAVIDRDGSGGSTPEPYQLRRIVDGVAEMEACREHRP